MSSSFRIELDNWLKTIDVKAQQVLDIGGAQLPIGPNRVKSWDVQAYKSVDLPEPHADSPKPEIGLDINMPWYANDYADLISDVVFCLEVFDYVYDPMEAFKNLERVMGFKSTAYVSFPSIYPLHQPVNDDALRYMPGGIAKLAQRAGLVIANMTPRRFETDAWDKTWRAERMRAAKHEDHNFSGWLVELKR